MSVLSATDLSPSALAASQLALEWGRRLHQPVTLVHVLDPASPCAGQDAAAQSTRHLERVAEAGSALGLAAPTVLAGSRGEEIERLARASGAQLLVLGVHGRLDAPASCRHAVIAHLLRSLPCPILLVPHEGPHPSWSEPPAERLRLAVELEPVTAASVLGWVRTLRHHAACDVTFLRLTGPATSGLDPVLAPLIAYLPGEGECALVVKHEQDTGIDPRVWEAFVARAHLLVLGVSPEGAAAGRVLAALRQTTAPILCVPV
jgi:nucleotide-binding universal stress UspA family protein